MVCRMKKYPVFLLQRKFTFTVNMHLKNNQVFDVYILTLTYKTYNTIRSIVVSLEYTVIYAFQTTLHNSC